MATNWYGIPASGAKYKETQSWKNSIIWNFLHTLYNRKTLFNDVSYSFYAISYLSGEIKIRGLWETLQMSGKSLLQSPAPLKMTRIKYSNTQSYDKTIEICVSREPQIEILEIIFDLFNNLNLQLTHRVQWWQMRVMFTYVHQLLWTWCIKGRTVHYLSRT